MPQDYRRGGTLTAGPMRSNGVFAPAHNDDADSLLRARTAVLNPAKMTAEHRAAYYAFAGISDHRTAADLHKHYVTWDDVSAYTAAGVGLTDYKRMMRLRLAGVTPAVLTSYKGMLDAAVIACHQADVTPATALSYLFTTSNGLAAIQPADAVHIPALVAAAASPHDCLGYRHAGISDASIIARLHRAGCTPEVVSGYATHSRQRLNPTAFSVAYGTATTYCGTPDIPNAVFTLGGTLADAKNWNDLLLPAEQTSLLILAGVTPAEVLANPDLADADPHVLAAFAGLRGTPAPVTASTLGLIA